MNVENVLADAIRLRASGQAEAARNRLLALAAAYPDEARVHFQAAWAHDVLGLEREAVPFYERALDLGLHGDDLAGALLGLGSTYRTLGEYQRSIARLRQGVEEFPDNRAMEVFLAMTLYNAGDHREAMERLLRIIVDRSEDASIREYNRAIAFYADKLDKTW